MDRLAKKNMASEGLVCADTNVVNNPNSDGLCGVSGIDKFVKFKLFYESEKDYSGACFDDAALSTNMPQGFSSWNESYD
ncbi:hypothetical protein F442_14005 [Phytophthora nicotianae P10297]|uniref:Uncharacterized protein n=1 Tax=Phytophthora nicotianae P10297 TaxID=1317064 RepID=W2YUA6_PHYNI|nr:hypothetical protein F442_14005 [Phytophthora nicotianae P10297]